MLGIKASLGFAGQPVAWDTSCVASGWDTRLVAKRQTVSQYKPRPNMCRRHSEKSIVGVVISLDEKMQEPGIDGLLALVTADMERVNQTILSRAASDVSMIPEVANHLISSGGKRLRPMLTLATAGLCGYSGTGHIKLAASVEFMHTATLLHDDVVDESDMRRGKLAARMLWGNEASVLVGDYLLGQAFKMMVEVGSLPCLDVLSSAAAVIAEGEVMQLSAAKDTETSEDDYLAVIRAKTAALFGAASEVGALLGQRPKPEIAACRGYGLNLGIAFQLIDDALDYGGTSAKLGKNVGDDFREGKITLPVVLSFRRGSQKQREFWRRTLEQGEIAEDDLETAIATLHQHRALEDTIERARHYGAMARDALELFPAVAVEIRLERRRRFLRQPRLLIACLRFRQSPIQIGGHVCATVSRLTRVWLPKIRSPGGASGQDRRRIPGVAPVPRHRRSDQDRRPRVPGFDRWSDCRRRALARKASSWAISFSRRTTAMVMSVNPASVKESLIGSIW